MSVDHLYCQWMENIPLFSLLLLFSLSFSLSRRACVFAVLAAWRECGMGRGYRTCVCVMKRVTKMKPGGDGVCLGISMLRVSALSPSPSLSLSLTHQSLSPQCPWQLYHQNTPAKEDNCNLSTAERLRGRVSEIVCACAFSHVCGICARWRARDGALDCIPEVLHRIVIVVPVRDQRICLRR